MIFTLHGDGTMGYWNDGMMGKALNFLFCRHCGIRFANIPSFQY